MAVILGVLVAEIVLFKTKPEHFGEYKSGFKVDAFSQNYYYILIG